MPEVERLMHLTDLEIEALSIAPNASEFSASTSASLPPRPRSRKPARSFSTALDERHRLVSLVPPVHIAIVDASRIYETLGEALTLYAKRQRTQPGSHIHHWTIAHRGHRIDADDRSTRPAGVVRNRQRINLMQHHLLCNRRFRLASAAYGHYLARQRSRHRLPSGLRKTV